MRNHLSRLFGAALIVSAAACSGAPEDFTGADNSPPQLQAGACERLRNCCLQLADEARPGCLDGANGSEADCTRSLQSGVCP